jgi:tRNA A37 threonylcarbamoyladenosine biosynthesis protein TsaE
MHRNDKVSVIPSEVEGSHAPVPTIICIEWPEKGTLPYPGVHVYIEHEEVTARKITTSLPQS